MNKKPYKYNLKVWKLKKIVNTNVRKIAKNVKKGTESCENEKKCAWKCEK